jgi:hypothetical protein
MIKMAAIKTKRQDKMKEQNRRDEMAEGKQVE